MEELIPGQSIGHLRIDRELARGGFAVVYLAEDTRLRRKVALKVLHSPMQKGTSEGEFGAFLDEARVIARLASPYVVTLFSLQEADDGSLILEMEYVPSGTLDDLLVEGGLAVDRAEAILRDVLNGLAAAHEDGVLHRDVKPANVLIARGGTAKLSDFGLARVMSEDAEIGEGPMGTPYYMAPEQLAGSPASEQSDLWSVGVVAYQLLAGTRPFPTRDAVSFFVTVQNDDPIPLPPHVPPRLRELVMSCLEKDPAGRPASCKEALTRLDQAQIRPVPSRVRVSPSRSFHGREEELHRLDHALEPDGSRTLLVAGPAGIGKSALLAEAARRARARGVLWVDARLSKIEGPLVTLVEAVRRVTPSAEGAITNAFGPDDSKLKAILQDGDLPALESSQQVLWTLQHLLSGVARTRHLVLSVDDAQNASEEDLSLLSDLAHRFTEQPFTLMVATRPAAHAMAGFADAERLELAGLDEEALFTFLEDRLLASLEGRVVGRVHQRTDGNPLQALELMRHLEATGALDRREDTLVATQQWERETVPARLRDLVHARMVRLADADRALLEVAAVDGPVFDGRAVAAVQGVPVLEVLRRLQALSRTRALIEPASHGYRFANRPTQEVLYEDMAPELRVELHRALAEHLEERSHDVEPARLARHWERSGNRKRAAPYLIQVATRAKNRQEWRRLIDYTRRAGLLDDPPLVDLGEHAEVAVAAASALIRSGRHEEGDTLYVRVEQAASRAENARLVERVVVHRATACLTNGRRPEGDEGHWEALAERLGETLEGANARAVIGRLAKLDGRFDAARSAFEEADRVYRSHGDDWHHTVMQDQLGAVAMRENRLADAQSSFTAAADLADSLGNTNNAAVSRTNATLAGMLDGDVDGADHELHRAVRTFDLHGSTTQAAHVRIYLAEALYANGRSADALTEIESAVAALEKADNRRALTNAWRLRAELLALKDRAAEAREAIARALENSEASQDRIQLIVAYAVQALIATASGAPEDATLALEGLEVANPDRSVPGDGAILALSEAVLYGLPPESLEAVGYLARNDQEKHLLDATLRCVHGEDCDAPLAAMDVDSIGLRQATYRLLNAWLAAESAMRREDEASLPRLTAAAREAATVMGHERALRSLGG